MSIIGFCAMLVALGVIAVKRYQIRFNWKVVKENNIKK
jgi:hypothetical protein